MPIKYVKTSGLITWDFSVGFNTLQTRYGHNGEYLYKQYTPGGAVDDNRWPPRPIQRAHYELAKREAAKQAPPAET